MSNNKQILGDSISKHGVPFQLELLAEECAELIVAINKCKRMGLIKDWGIPRPNSEHLVAEIASFSNLHEEIADVSIMIDKMNIILNPALIQSFKESKLKRLENLLKKP